MQASELLNRAVARHRAGRADEAEALYRLTLAADPDEPNALVVLAALERSRGDREAALARLLRAAAAAPKRTDVQLALGDLLRDCGDLDAALAAYAAAIDAAPAEPKGWLRKSGLLLERGMNDAAAACLETALDILPGHAGILDSCGVACLRSGRFHAAAERFALARRSAPDRADLAVKQAAACLEVGRLEQAIDAFSDAIAAGDRAPAVRTEQALALFAAGRCDEAWAAYEARWTAEGEAPPPALAGRRWTGTLRPDTWLLVCAEQGVGDQIMFAAGLPAVAETIGQEGRLVVECAAKLAPLFARAWPEAHIEAARGEPSAGLFRASYGWIAAHEPLEAVAYMADLPRHLADRMDGGAYLRADAGRAREWAGWLDTLGPGPRIGMCWRSSIGGDYRERRVPPAAAWRQVLEAFPDARFVSLQYDDPTGASWAPALEGANARIHVPPGLDQFDDLDGVAALMSGLDLVISAPTAVSALAGALGRPSLRLIRGCDWTLMGQAHSAFCTAQDTVLLSREWYGPAAMAPVIAAARSMLARPAGEALR